MGIREYESVMKAIADPTRVRILKILEGGEMCVCQIIAILSLGQSTVSKTPLPAPGSRAHQGPAGPEMGPLLAGPW